MREVPSHLDITTRKFLSDMRKQVVELTANRVDPARSVSNLQVTPIAGGNRVRFSKTNADNYLLYVGSSPAITEAQVINLGNTSDYTDNVGSGGVDRWYWIQGQITGKASSSPTGPMKGTTLALGVASTVPVAPPETDDYGFRDKRYPDLER